MDKQGSSDELGRISLDSYGDLIFEDDGDPDTYVRLILETDDQSYNIATTDMFAHIRNDGDDVLADLLDELDVESSVGPTSFEQTGPFVCDDCHLTHPSKDKHEQDGATLCPSCAD